MRQSSTRRARRERRTAGTSTQAAPAYVTRNIPYYDFLDEDALVRIEQQADWLLQENGIEFRDDPHALELWKGAGADVQ
ncbi:MAG: trimethylamine methyltransferase, partial [Rhizobiales bacterium]|nr:trimethylamine methyltransferase [Hyphomicrobiales bacterium]